MFLTLLFRALFFGRIFEGFLNCILAPRISKIDEKLIFGTTMPGSHKIWKWPNRRSFYSRYFQNFHVFWDFCWGLPEPSVSVFTILNCREPSLSVLHDRINNPLAFFTICQEPSVGVLHDFDFQERSVGVTSRSSVSRTIRWRDTQKVPSGTTMRRACELVARQGLLCRGASKIDVCSSVRPFVRTSVRSFVRPQLFWTVSKPVKWSYQRQNARKSAQKWSKSVTSTTCDQIDAKRRHNRSWRATLLRGSI